MRCVTRCWCEHLFGVGGMRYVTLCWCELCLELKWDMLLYVDVNESVICYSMLMWTLFGVGVWDMLLYVDVNSVWSWSVRYVTLCWCELWSWSVGVWDMLLYVDVNFMLMSVWSWSMRYVTLCWCELCLELECEICYFMLMWTLFGVGVWRYVTLCWCELCLVLKCEICYFMLMWTLFVCWSVRYVTLCWCEHCLELECGICSSMLMWTLICEHRLGLAIAGRSGIFIKISLSLVSCLSLLVASSISANTVFMS